jgi:hypothetical protein
VGEFSGLTWERSGVVPYVWDLSSAGLVTFKDDGGHVTLPYQDFWVRLTIPRFAHSPARLEIRPGYTWESTLGYYGLGNASSSALPAGAPGASASYFWYGRLHPSISAVLRWRIIDHLAGITGVRFTQNFLQVAAGSKLAQDLAYGSPEVRTLLGSTAPHAVALFTNGLQWDDRDSEVSPGRGSFVQAILKLSPGGVPSFPYRFGQATFLCSHFEPLGSSKTTVLGIRWVADVLFGNPPFYELPRYEDTYAIGGDQGVRGVPAQRYYGKVKTFGNLELRQRAASFELFGKRLDLGLAAFFDAGRVWADTSPHPELDGTGMSIKYGVGGGIRVQSGVAFLVRADVAWSPDARPLGGYFSAGEAF